MIYVVSGYRRSGTSLMMKMLSASLTDAKVFYDERMEEKFNIPVEGYQPNPGGLWEVSQMRYMVPSFMRDVRTIAASDDNKTIIKVFYDGLPTLPAAEYTIIFMRRNPAEIQASIQGLQSYFDAIKKGPAKKHDYPFDVFRPYDEEDIQHVLDICQQRRDIQLHTVQYEGLVDDPRAALSAMVMAGIPIDVDKAAAVVNPALHRNKCA